MNVEMIEYVPDAILINRFGRFWRAVYVRDEGEKHQVSSIVNFIST